MAHLHRILVPLDFSDASARALKQAKSVAARFKATIELLHVVANPYTLDTSPFYTPLPASFLNELEKAAEKRLDKSLTRAERNTFKARSVVVVGDPLRAIVEHATREKVDLIVMGTHGRKGIAHLFVGRLERRNRNQPRPRFSCRFDSCYRVSLGCPRIHAGLSCLRMAAAAAATAHGTSTWPMPCGGAALMAAADRPREIAAVVSRGGRPDLAGPTLAKVTTPTLLIVGGLDTAVIQMNRDAMKQMHGEVTLEIVPGATHLFDEPGTLQRVAELANGWFARYLQPLHD